MRLVSTAFEPESPIPTKYTCDGENVSPPLQIRDVPEGATSLALIMDDPDAIGGNFIHWTVWNIDPKSHDLPEGSLTPGATEGRTSFATPGYGGPCPPNNRHRYYFRLYALDTFLRLGQSSSRADLDVAMEGHILAQAELMGIYDRVG